MAGFAQYDQQIAPKPQPAPYDETRVSPEALGAGIGEGVARLAGTVEDVRQRAIAARTMKEVGDFGTDLDTILHDPKEGVLNQRGEAALGSYSGSLEKLQKAQQDRAAKIGDPYARDLFLQQSTEVMRAARRQLEIHTAGQRDALEQLGVQSTQKSMLDQSVKAIDQVSADSFTKVGADATRAFWAQRANGAVADEKSREYTAVSNGQRLDRLLADPNSAAEAQRFFKARYNDLPADKLDEYEKRVLAVGVVNKGEAYAQQLIADPANRISGTVLLDANAIQQKVAQLQEPVQIKDEVLRRALHYTTIRTEEQDKKNSVVFGRALADLDKTGLVNPNDLAYLQNDKFGAGKYLDTFQQMQRRNAEQAINAPPTVAQEAAYGRAQLAVGADNREFWATRSYDQMAGTFGAQVTRAQLGDLGRTLDATHKWADEQQRSDRNQAIQMQVKDRLVKNAGFNKDPIKWSDEQWAVFSRALTDVKVQQQAFLTNKQGVQPTPDDVKKWIDVPLAKVKVSGTGLIWDDKPVRAAAEALPQYQGKSAVYVIPSNEQKLIDKQLRQSGFQVNDQNRQTLYRRKHGF